MHPSDLNVLIAQSEIDSSSAVVIALLLGEQKNHQPTSKLLLSKFNKAQTNTGQTDLAKYFARLIIKPLLSGQLVSGREIAEAVAVLVNAEVAVSGPYGLSNKKIDLLDNILIAHFLQSQKAHAQGLEQYITLQAQALKVTGYRDLELLFLLSKLNFIDRRLIKSKLAGKRPLASTRLGQYLSRESLNKIQNPEYTAASAQGALSSDSVQDIVEITAAMAMQGKSRHLEVRTKESDFAQAVYAAAFQETQNLDEPLKTALCAAIEQLQVTDKTHEISLFSYHFLQTVSGLSSEEMNHMALRLGMANVFCWVAYTVYDDCIDDELDNTAHVLTANTAMRRSITFYNSIINSAEHQKAESFFDRMDEANAWELQHARFGVHKDIITISKIPDYRGGSVLLNRAAGHVAGPLLAAERLGFGKKDTQLLRRGLHHYIVAKQMSDDIHDWSEDLKRGHCSIVVARLLSGCAVRAESSYHLKELHRELQEYFYKEGFLAISSSALRHARRAHDLLGEVSRLTVGSSFIKLLDSVSYGIEKSIAVYNDHQDFLRYYKNQRLN